MEHFTTIAAAILATITAITVGYWQFVYKPKRQESADPTPGGRALDSLFTEKDRLAEQLEAERRDHRVSRDEYLHVSKRLATVEADLRAARQDIRERDAMIHHLRDELAEVRREIAEMRRHANEG